MRFNDFLIKYNGKFVEAGGSANALNMCVDLANAYLDEVLGLPMVFHTDAKDFPSKLTKDFTYIRNTPEGIPSEGDLMVWDGGTWGHIAIFIEGTTGSFRSFDQNYPVGTHAHVQGHYYTNGLGWLHPKGSMAYYKGIDLTNTDSVKACIDAWKDVVDGKYVKKDELVACQTKIKENDEVWEERVKNEKKQLDEFLRTLAEKLGTVQQEPAIVEQITRLLQVEDRVSSDLEPKIKKLEERVAGLARIVEVPEEKLEETIKKLVKDGVVTVSPEGHSRLCRLLARLGL